MSSAANTPKYGAVALGGVGVVASWKTQTSAMNSHPMLIIQSCASTDENGHEPAASVTLFGRDSLIDLRKAIDAALNEGGAA